MLGQHGSADGEHMSGSLTQDAATRVPGGVLGDEDQSRFPGATGSDHRLEADRQPAHASSETQ